MDTLDYGSLNHHHSVHRHLLTTTVWLTVFYTLAFQIAASILCHENFGLI